MRNRMPLGLAAAGAGCCIWAAVALAAPANTKLPSISGKPAYGSTLTCNKGTWSSDATRFDYAWLYANSPGLPALATSQKWRVNKAVGYNVVCQVTAHDAQGATTSAQSPQVLLTTGISTVRVLKVAQKHGKLTFTAVAGPSGALKHDSFNRPTVVLYRKQPHDLLQISSSPVIVKARSGRFTIGGHDTPGMHVYILQFAPASSSQYAVSHTSRTVTVKR